MPNLVNVLPQVNAKSSSLGGTTPASASTQEQKSNAEAAVAFQTSLKDASQKVAPTKDDAETLGKVLFESNQASIENGGEKKKQKDDAEKAIATLMAGAGTVPPAPTPQLAGVAIDPKAALTQKNAFIEEAAGKKAVGIQVQKNRVSSLVPAPNIQAAAQVAAAQVQASIELKEKDGATDAMSLNGLPIEDAAGANLGAMAGIELSALPPEHDFKMESMEVNAPKLPSSKFSTSDYLNLREISQNSIKNPSPISAPSVQNFNSAQPSAAVGLGSLSPSLLALNQNVEKGESVRKGKIIQGSAEAGSAMMAVALGERKNPSHTIDAHVTQGSANKPVLSHDALQQMSHQVNLMSQAKQDGEIKIRLRPEHLGELRMIVKTDGQHVSVQIHAPEGEAKKMIEESLGSLRDSLAQKDLTLSSLSVVTPGSASADGNFQADTGAFRQNFDQNSQAFGDQRSNQQAWNQSEQNSNRQASRMFEEDAPRSNLSRMNPAAMARTTSSSQRLDLIA